MNPIDAIRNQFAILMMMFLIYIQIMSKSVYEIWVQPITFKTVSFHHRAHYAIKLYLSSEHRLISAKTLFPVGRKKEIITDRRTGNISGIGGLVDEKGIFMSEKFLIEFNDQCAKFETGIWLRVELDTEVYVTIAIELCRFDMDIIKDGQVSRIQNPTEKKVSQQVLNVCIRMSKQPLIKPFGYRKLIFPTNEYISFIEMGCYVCETGWLPSLKDLRSRKQQYLKGNFNCCIVNPKKPDAQEFLSQIYRLAVQSKLQLYAVMVEQVREKIKQYLWIKKYRSNSLRGNFQFQKLYILSQIPNLSYVSLSRHEMGVDSLESNVPIIRNKSLAELFCDHYECKFQEIGWFIVEESFRLQQNIRSLFQRLIQISFSICEGIGLEIAINEMKRVKLFMRQCMVDNYNAQRSVITNQMAFIHNTKIKQLLYKLQNFSDLEKKQPIIMLSGELSNGKPLEITRTLTLLLHGFRGNQFDLSKLKSYLGLFLGFSHFYALKSIAGGDGENVNISKLGQLAGEQVSKYLQQNPTIKFINVIGFSMGGVIARAMLKHIKNHHSKLNLLLTLASPHLGLKEIESCLVRAGMFYMKKVAKVESMQDLSYDQTEEGRSNFLLDLAKCEYINSFKWVVLVGSREDEYVPLYSSLCDYKGENVLINELKDHFQNQREDIVRFCARVQPEQTLWDMLTLRRTHINLLQNDSFIRLLVVKLQHYFTHTR